MRVHLVAVRDAVRRWAAAPFDANPMLWGFYGLLAAWTALGVFTLFFGMVGLVVQGVLLVLLPAVALLACFDVARTLTAGAKFHTVTAFVVALALVPACPNDAGPYVFFAVHGGQLEAICRELADTHDDVYFDARRRFEVEPMGMVRGDAFEPLRRRLGHAGVLGVGVRGDHIVFPIDGFADNVRGFVYVRPGTPLPKSGNDFHHGMLAQFVPMSTPGWYFFTTV